MLALVTSIVPNVTLSNGVGEYVLGYQPSLSVGGNGVSGSSFVDNANYRDYVFKNYRAKALDMETAIAAHVATQFGVGFIFFRALSDLAGAENDNNSYERFFELAAVNAVTAVSEFLAVLPSENNSTEVSVEPSDHVYGESTPGLVGLLCFDRAGIDALKRAITDEKGLVTELVFGGRRFYRGKIEGANVVAVFTGSSANNAAMTTALILQLFPGIDTIIGSGIAKGVDPSLKMGDIVIPERWAQSQEQLLAKEPRSNLYIPLEFERKLLVGRQCGGFDGISTFLTGDRACDASRGDASNFGFFFPKTVQTPEPKSSAAINRITEGPTRKWWFEADPRLLDLARNAAARAHLPMLSEKKYTSNVVVGGNAVSGPSLVDNDGYRAHIFREFGARYTDSEAGAAAHIAYQNNVPFIFFHTLSSRAGSGDAVPDTLPALAAENTLTVISDLLRETFETNSPTASPTEPLSTSRSASPLLVGLFAVDFSVMLLFY